MSDLLLSTTVLASFLGGVVALLAPCCISVMLPAYFASTFRRRTRIAFMTLVFSLGVGTVILPIALGASALSRLLLAQHAWIFGIGGLLMVVGGLLMLAGFRFSLPMPGGGGTTGDGGLRSVYGLGVFAGGASACCAPVLLGVAALSGAAASFPIALAVGVAYVFGMVAPLAVIALVWDRRRWGGTALQQRTIGIGRRRVPLGNALSGGLLIAMGLLTAGLAVSGTGMATGGWQRSVSSWTQHAAAIALDGLSWLPGWVGALLVLAALAVFVRAAVRRRPEQVSDASGTGREPDPSTTQHAETSASRSLEKTL